MKISRGLTIDRMVKLGRVSRSGFYRFEDADPGPDPDMDLRDAIQKIALEWPSYGRPRITAELRRRGRPSASPLREGLWCKRGPASAMMYGCRHSYR